MQVIKRNGQRESCSFDKITARISKLSDGLTIDAALVSQKVVAGVVNDIHTSQIDTLAAETAAYMSTSHHDYGTLAGRIEASNHQKNTKDSFLETTELVHSKNNGLFSDAFMDAVREHAEVLERAIDYERDFLFDFFAFRTLARSYLLKIDGEIVTERPQHMWMRVAVGIHLDDVDAAIETYEMMSTRQFTHATPTLFNSGFRKSQMSSCFLMTMRDDSITGIFDTLAQCAQISKYAGGVGLSVHNVRAKSRPIMGTNGTSNGLVPMLRVFDAAAMYVDQGGSRRKGSIAIYIEPWHADIEDFLRLKRNQVKEEFSAKNLFYGLWVCDLFMKRLKADGQWTLFSPDKAPGLHLVWGEEFEALYEKYEREGLGEKTMKAADLFHQIYTTQIETGTPYFCFKDAVNRTSNHQHLGTIGCMNLCTEIAQFTSKDEVAVCNLASISLPAFCGENGYDWAGLRKAAKVLTRNLNKVIDLNFYPVPEARNSNMRHRPIGVGVQGLADVFAFYKMSFDSPEARDLDARIFENIYYACLEASCELAQKYGKYESYEGSPFSKGILQMDMWPKAAEEPSNKRRRISAHELDWPKLRADIAAHGTRNSLLTALMPTASTSQILGNTECFEAFNSNIYSRKTLAGDFFVVNKWLVRDLEGLGLWTKATRDKIIADGGSVQGLDNVPAEVRERYRTVWEIKQKSVLEMARRRAPFVDQSQSLNIHMADPTYQKFLGMCVSAHEMGLLNMYYLRTQSIVKPIQFSQVNGNTKSVPEREEEEECLTCSA